MYLTGSAFQDTQILTQNETQGCLTELKWQKANIFWTLCLQMNALDPKAREKPSVASQVLKAALSLNNLLYRTKALALGNTN